MIFNFMSFSSQGKFFINAAYFYYCTIVKLYFLRSYCKFVCWCIMQCFEIITRQYWCEVFATIAVFLGIPCSSVLRHGTDNILASVSDQSTRGPNKSSTCIMHISISTLASWTHANKLWIILTKQKWEKKWERQRNYLTFYWSLLDLNNLIHLQG